MCATKRGMAGIVHEIRFETRDDEDPERYPYRLPAVRALMEAGSLPLHPRVTFFVGENGSGKSTLIEAVAIAAGFNPEGGSRNFAFGTRTSHSPLHEHLLLARGTRPLRHGFFLRAESLFNVATEIERLDEGPGGPPILHAYGGVSLHEQSHGESFLAVMKHRFHGGGFYVLDEPEAALSPRRQISLLALLDQLCLKGAQFVIATHAPILMAYPEATIYVLGEHGIEARPYDEVEHVQTTRAFLNAPQRYLGALFDEDDPA